jgi:hypothetical protein
MVATSDLRAMTSLAFKALTTYSQTRFALMREYSIGKRLVEGYLHQPYSWFLNRHSADLGKTILSEELDVFRDGDEEVQKVDFVVGGVGVFHKLINLTSWYFGTWGVVVC